jgi:hypothetical protein
LNPCKNGGTCLEIDIGFICKCPPECRGIDCSNCEVEHFKPIAHFAEKAQPPMPILNITVTISNSTTTSNTSNYTNESDVIKTTEASLVFEVCKDVNESFCKEFANADNCQLDDPAKSMNVNGTLILDLCAKSCGKCSICADLLPSCGSAIEFCEYFDEKRHPCRVSCNSC